MKKDIIFTLIITSVFIYSCSKKAGLEKAIITFSLGDVKKNGIALNTGDEVNNDEMIITGKKSMCDLRLGESLIRIKEKSQFKIISFIKNNSAENTEVELSSGKILCKPKKLLKSGSFVVKTPTAVAGVRGTTFLVETSSDNKTIVKVYEGKVKVAKRIKLLEKSESKVLEVSPVVSDNEMIEITPDEVGKAEALVNSRIKTQDQVSDKLIENLKNEITFNEEDIKKIPVNEKDSIKSEVENFNMKYKEVNKIHLNNDSSKNKNDKIDYQKKPEVAKKQPAIIGRGGRLMVTRYNIIYIKSGKVLWQENLIHMPVKRGKYTFVASSKYVFCSLDSGKIVWMRRMNNSGKVQFSEKGLFVYTSRGKMNLNLKDGKDIL